MQKTQRQTQRNGCKKCFANTFLGFPLLNNGEERKEEKCAIPLEIGGWGIWHQCESEIDPMSPLCLSEDPTIRTGKARPHSSGKGRGGPKNIDWQGLSLFPDANPKSFTCHPDIVLHCTQCSALTLTMLREMIASIWNCHWKAIWLIFLSQNQTQLKTPKTQRWFIPF